MPSVIDQMGREVIFQSTKRIVSLVPSQTELLIDLGLREQIVGITKYCIHPPELRQELNIIGGTKDLDIDKIRALNPDIIIANKEENQQDQIETLSKEFPVWISDINKFEEAWEMIRAIGHIFQKEKLSDLMVQKGQEKWAKLASPRIQASCLYFIWQKPYMLAGENTFINAVLKHIGIHNLAEQLESRYPEISLEKIKGLNPDYIFLSSEPYPFKEKNKNQMEGFGLEGSVHLVDGEYFSWYGSRLVHAADYFEELKSKLHL